MSPAARKPRRPHTPGDCLPDDQEPVTDWAPVPDHNCLQRVVRCSVCGEEQLEARALDDVDAEPG